MLTPNSKIILAFTMICSLTATSAHAGWFGSNKKSDQQQGEALSQILNATLPADQENAQRQALQEMAATMTPRLTEIQKLLAEENSEQALNLAKSTLDEVRIKTGIDPKARLREKFLVPAVFPEGATGMASLSPELQEVVIRTVKDFRGGLYLDILNLSKRTSLLYIKAFHQQVRKDGGLTEEDRNKIIKDLAVATIVPMPIQDKNGKVITVFDEEVANEDHTYFFNREIKMYLLSSKDLSIDETRFNEYKAQLKGNAQPAKQTTTVSTSYDKGLACMGLASNIGASNPRYDAEVSCFKKYAFSLKNGRECMDLAGYIGASNPRYDAQASCAKSYEQ